MKIALPGKTTQHGQGPGTWIHPGCVLEGVSLSPEGDSLFRKED